MAQINNDKAAMYLVAIVGVVAAVGIIVLLMGNNISSETTNISGQATAVPSGATCCAWTSWSDGTQHCISYSYSPCPRRKL